MQLPRCQKMFVSKRKLLSMPQPIRCKIRPSTTVNVTLDATLYCMGNRAEEAVHRDVRIATIRVNDRLDMLESAVKRVEAEPVPLECCINCS